MENGRDYFDTLHEAVISAAKQDHNAAIEACERAFTIRPDGPEAYCVLGLIASAMEDFGRSIGLLEKAHAADPDCRDYVDVLAVICTRAGKLTDGLYYAKLALALQPNPQVSVFIPPVFRDYRLAIDNASPSANFLNAMVLVDRRMFVTAEEECLRYLRLNERDVDACRLLGRIRLVRRNFEGALAALNKSLDLDPENPQSHLLMGDCLSGLGAFDEARQHHAKAASLAPGDVNLLSRIRYSASRLPDVDWSAYMADGRHMAKACFAGVDALDLGDLSSRRDNGKIRIGYLSDGFWNSPYRPFFEAIFNGHDRQRVEIYGYQQNLGSDSSTIQFKVKADRWRELYDVDDDTAAYIIASDGLDILVDLCSYGEGQRLSLLARKPAPVLVNWLSWPHGSELPGIDVVLSSHTTLTADEALADGPICQLIDAGLLAFDADSLARAPLEAPDGPAATAGAVTFGGVCDLARLTPEVARTWSRVLAATPGGRLMLGYVQAGCPAVQKRAQELFAAWDMADRVTFQAALTEEKGETFFAEVDVVLDTFPINGVTETCEALLAGVPVVALAGSQRMSLMGASILRAAGCDEWVATSEDAFVDIAVALGTDLPRLAERRRSLGDSVRASSLCDVKAFGTSLEGVYERILRGKGLR